MKLLIVVLALLPISLALPFQPETEVEAIGRDDDDYNPSWDDYYDDEELDEELELDDYEQEMYNNAMQDAELGATGRDDDDDDDYYDYEEELELDDDEQEMYDEAMQDA